MDIQTIGCPYYAPWSGGLCSEGGTEDTTGCVVEEIVDGLRAVSMKVELSISGG